MNENINKQVHYCTSTTSIWDACHSGLHYSIDWKWLIEGQTLYKGIKKQKKTKSKQSHIIVDVCAMDIPVRQSVSSCAMTCIGNILSI